MKKRALLILISTWYGCVPNTIEHHTPTYSLSIDSILNEQGTTSLNVDVNGFFVFDLDSGGVEKQTIRRIIGTVTKDSVVPYPSEVIDWESSHSWFTSSDYGFYVRRTINYLGQWVTIDTIYPNLPSGLLVPTINPTSISGTNGEINTMFAPIFGMRGDTVVIVARLWTPYDKIYSDTISIILK